MEAFDDGTLFGKVKNPDYQKKGDAMTSITVFGAGSWGTALADHLRRAGHDVTLWCRRTEQARVINLTGKNPDYLSDIDLATGITATSDLAEAATLAERFVMAVPTQQVRSFLTGARKVLPPECSICNVAKGIEISTGYRISQIVEAMLPGAKYAVLSGPSHAEEVARMKPTAVVSASRLPEEARIWQEIFTARYFRVYTSDDVTGVETGGAVKNVIAIAAGITAAMGLGDNALAALVSRGLAEVMRFGAKTGAHPLTLAGLAGIGDLMVTCYSDLSRNYRLGKAVGSGVRPQQAIEELGQVAEGFYTVAALVRQARQLGVELPITEAVYQILYEGKTPKQALDDLFSRELKSEVPPEILWGHGQGQ